MGRLIDADVLELFIKTHSCSVGTDGVLLTVGEDKRWHNLLEYIQTAYDVDKVVEELEKAKHEIASEDYCRSINDKGKCDGRNCFECCAEYLIEIVKQGIISDDACEWKKYLKYPCVWIVGCELDLIASKQGGYCPYCGKKIKVVE